MSKGLELLEKYEDKYTFASQFNGDRLPDYQTRKMLEPIEKELKALEIIKDKAVSMAILIHSTSIEEYNHCKNLLAFDLTQEEYDLLKEVLL